MFCRLCAFHSCLCQVVWTLTTQGWFCENIDIMIGSLSLTQLLSFLFYHVPELMSSLSSFQSYSKVVVCLICVCFPIFILYGNIICKETNKNLVAQNDADTCALFGLGVSSLFTILSALTCNCKVTLTVSLIKKKKEKRRGEKKKRRLKISSGTGTSILTDSDTLWGKHCDSITVDRVEQKGGKMLVCQAKLPCHPCIVNGVINWCGCADELYVLLTNLPVGGVCVAHRLS